MMNIEKTVVTVAMWVLFLSGFYGVFTSFSWYFGGRPFSEYMPAGAIAGGYLFAGIVASYLKNRK